MLAQSGRIRTAGLTRNRRYFAPERAAPGPADSAAQTGAKIPLSADALQVQRAIRQPAATKRPIGYQEQFLEAYIPGQTWYLPETTRTTLHEMGSTAEASRPAGTFARDIFERLLIDLAWSSSRLEGNTYNRIDTQNLLEHGIRADGKDATEAQMILNHKKAIALLVDQAEQIGFNRYTILNLHAALSEGLLADARDEGRLREKMVGVTGTVFVPISIPQKIEEHFDVILAKASDIPDPFEQSFFMMVHLPYLQPFIDVNKRTSRLAANISLVKTNLRPLSFIGVPEQAYVDGTLAVYELNRVELLRDLYVWAYARSCEQYHVVQTSLVQPNPVRLRYRQEINGVIREMVVKGEPPVRSAIARQVLQHEIPANDHDAFVEIALELLVNLHEGATYRYGIRPIEFQSWKNNIRPT